MEIQTVNQRIKLLKASRTKRLMIFKDMKLALRPDCSIKKYVVMCLEENKTELGAVHPLKRTI